MCAMRRGPDADERRVYCMEKNWKANIYYGIPDTDLDGDVDYVDRLNWENSQRSLNERHTPDEDDDEWRDDIDEDDAEDLGIDPYDYDSADEYIEALEDADFNMGLWGDELPDDIWQRGSES